MHGIDVKPTLRKFYTNISSLKVNILNIIMRQRTMQAGWDYCEKHFADLWTLLPGKSIVSWILVVLTEKVLAAGYPPPQEER